MYAVYLHSQDFDRFSSWQDTLLDELQRVLTEHADKQRYMFVGAVTVTLERDDEVRAGRFETRVPHRARQRRSGDGSRGDRRRGQPDHRDRRTAVPAHRPR